MNQNKLKELRAVIIKYKFLCRAPQAPAPARTQAGLSYESQFRMLGGARWTARKPQAL